MFMRSNLRVNTKFPRQPLCIQTTSPHSYVEKQCQLNMNDSKEELIELEDLTSPIKEKPKKLMASKRRKKAPKSNTTYSVTSGGSATVSLDDDSIVNMFSVNAKTYSRSRASSSDQRTISEISDDVFLVKPESKQSTSGNSIKRNYKDKISEHLKKIKEKAINSSDLARSRLPIERIRRESEQIDVEIDNVRSKIKERDNNSKEIEAFFTFVEPKKEEGINSNKSNDQLVYTLPEKLDFSMTLAENECLFYINRKQRIDDSSKRGTAEMCYSDVPQICDSHRNILEQRFCIIEDRRWFDAEGNLNLLENPVTPISLRPSMHQMSDHRLTDYVPSSTNLCEDLTELVVLKENVLNVYLSHLKFHHHPLFSTEDIFAEKLKTTFEDYKAIQEDKTVSNLKARLELLRRRRYEHGDSTSTWNEIRRVRMKYFKESRRYKQIVLTILECWKHVKKIRSVQKYSNTDVKLLIKREKCDYDREKEEYRNMFDQSLEEMMREQGYEHIKEMSEDSIEEKSDGATTIASKDEESRSAKMRNQLRNILKTSLRTPGEPNVILALTNTNTLTEYSDFSKETTRRNVLFSTKFYLKILCNNIEACKTKFLNLNKNFALEVEEIFSLQLFDVPKYLTIEIYEQPKSLLKKKICEINIDVPSEKNPIKLCRANFHVNDIVHYKHEGVGSGVGLQSLMDYYGVKLLNIKDSQLKTSGYLEYGLEWENDEAVEAKDTMQTKMMELDEIVDKSFVVNFEKFGKFDEFKVDEGEQVEMSLERSEGSFFRLNPHLFSFCDISEIDENIRLKILQLRDQKEIEFDGMLVPNRIKEIPTNVLSQYLRRKAGEKPNLKIEVFENLKSQYYFGKKSLQQIHLKIFQLCKSTENNLDYESVVNEKYFIYFHVMLKTLLRNFFNWFRWRPKVNKPLPVLTKDDSDDNPQISKSTVSLTVRLIGARNLPNRKKRTFNDAASEPNEIRPYVEVNYKSMTARSSTSIGTNPLWNEDLVIPLESDHTDYLNPTSLDGIISVNLFDESENEIIKLNKKCINWMGGIDILLSAVCCSDTMSGLFQIKVPYLLTDYETLIEKHKSPNTPQSVYTYLEMEIFVEPSVPKLSPNMEEFPCGDVPYIHEYVLKWNKNFNSSYPHRKFNALVLDSNGKTTCATRFLKPSEPPQINNEEFDVSIEQCCRYVSLIPFTSCNHFYNNIWLSTDQLIGFMLGSVIDHAIALTCYLTALKVDVWLLLGYGIPHGNTAYVFLPEYPNDSAIPAYYIIDVVYNEKYNIMDENCPLQRIFCVMNNKNIWANVQKTDKPYLTRFEFDGNSDWLPLFRDGMHAPTNPVGDKVTYLAADDTEKYEMNLEKQLKKQISKLRLLDRTVWNSGVSSVLANVLKTFELNCMYNRNHHESFSELCQDISQYTVSGFAINTHFTSFSNLMRKIKQIGMHIQKEEDTEFAAAVYIHAYPGRLFSVWIFLINIRNND
ncbi:unnamed protein product [Phyllotreta striolata]|uniref:C2 domain-containing protein n=1 Tax=Phyllotreta striolata TaxID=444603 RepID=A0A9N9TQ33_PHYSR|nr:unnamed protein product [Phyllotreta striolata]